MVKSINKHYRNGDKLPAEDMNLIVSGINETMGNVADMAIVVGEHDEEIERLKEGAISIVNLTQEEYDNLPSYDDNTIYVIRD